jgi:hypothetical protein
MLPDVALLEIFDVYIDDNYEDENEREYDKKVGVWYTLVHVCRKWRNTVFGSPRRLDLRLYCRASTPVRQTLDVWPPLPIVIEVSGADPWNEGNIVAALEHNDRICELVIHDILSSERENALTALQQPFPALTNLYVVFDTETAAVIPTTFLGGSAPGLESLYLKHIPFPGLPKLLLTAAHLVDLNLRRIPQSGYISPETMVASLSVLTRLECLHIGFESPQSRPDQRIQRPAPRTRTVLPVLTLLRFKGVSDYLEDLVARIDVPQLEYLTITFFHQLILDAPQLTRFIIRTPKFKSQDESHVEFSHHKVTIIFPPAFDGALGLELGTSCTQSDWQLSFLAQVCSSSLTQSLIPTVEHLYIRRGFQGADWQDDIESGQWLELFHPFAATNELYISYEFTPSIATALKELVGHSDGVMEVLPVLQTLFLDDFWEPEGPPPLGPTQEAIKEFVSARQLAGHSLAISHWESEEDEWWDESDDD